MVPPITDIWVSTVFFTSLKMKVKQGAALHQIFEQNKNQGKNIPADVVEGGCGKVDLHQLKSSKFP